MSIKLSLDSFGFLLVTNLDQLTHAQTSAQRKKKKNDIGTNREKENPDEQRKKQRVQLQLYGNIRFAAREESRLTTKEYRLQYLHHIWLVRELDDVEH